MFSGVTRSTGGAFLVAFTRDKAKTFILISEDDLIDLVGDHVVEAEVMANVHDAITNLSVGIAMREVLPGVYEREIGASGHVACRHTRDDEISEPNFKAENFFGSG